MSSSGSKNPHGTFHEGFFWREGKARQGLRRARQYHRNIGGICMKVKKVKIGIKTLEEVLRDTGEVMKKIARGEKLKPVKESEVYFTSFEGFRKALQQNALGLIMLLKQQT